MDHVSRPLTSPLRGTTRVPGDKSISHRAVLFAAMAQGTSALSGVLDSEDVRSTIAAAHALGASVEPDQAEDGALALRITGWGGFGPSEPTAPIDCGNSGTTARLLMGVLAGWPVEVTLTGDDSLSRRPMRRVTGPLARMGAVCATTEGHLPVTVSGGGLVPIIFESPVASAQVKSAVLLAGLRAHGRTVVREPARSRDHTERLLPAFGVEVGIAEETRSCWVDGPEVLSAAGVAVPGDPSSAAFIAVAAALVPGSDVRIEGVALNPTRTAFLAVMERMGTRVDIAPEAGPGAEPAGTVLVRHTDTLRATTITPDEVPSLVDEIPVLALLASQAEGETRFEEVGELRVKESDRLTAIVEGLTALGVRAVAEGDTLVVSGPSRLAGDVVLDSLGDHRLAMTWALAGLIASAPVTVERFAAVDVSYPRFLDDLGALSSAGGGS